MKTLCFKVDETLFQAFKVHVAGSGKTMQQYMNDLLRDSLATLEDQLQSIGQIRAELDTLRNRIDAVDAALTVAEGRINAEGSKK